MISYFFDLESMVTKNNRKVACIYKLVKKIEWNNFFKNVIQNGDFK